MPAKTRSDLIGRLSPYWQMEAGNAVLVPAVLFILAEGRLSWLSAVPMAAMVLLLAVGALYWRGKVRQLRGAAADFPRLLRGLRRARLPALLLTVAGCATAVAAWIAPGWSAGTADRYVAAGSALLAVLEYVNYYHRQLQHFDNRADFARLLKGKGFRRSWLARDLDGLG